MDQISELYSVVTEWAASVGAKDINKLPGLWHQKTEKLGELGPLDVRINGHHETMDGIPPFCVKIGMDDYFPGIIGIIGPTGGALIGSPVPGEDEANLIEHFRKQVRQ